MIVAVLVCLLAGWLFVGPVSGNSK